MSARNTKDLSELSMLELFRLEVENQSVVITDNLLGLEQNPTDAARLGALMRAAHSLKGAARMVDNDAAVSVAHELEDLFVAAQEGSLALLPQHIDMLLQGVDLLKRIVQASDGQSTQEVQQFVRDLAKVRGVSPSEAMNGAPEFPESAAVSDRSE